MARSEYSKKFHKTAGDWQEGASSRIGTGLGSEYGDRVLKNLGENTFMGIKPQVGTQTGRSIEKKAKQKAQTFGSQSTVQGLQISKPTPK